MTYMFPTVEIEAPTIAELERLAKKIVMSGCWLWQGAAYKGYGSATYRGRGIRAHRLFYTAIKGEIPKGLTIDHLCRVKNCVNPAHLEAVLHEENSRRTRSEYCKKGLHKMEGYNIAQYKAKTPGRIALIRYCRKCGVLTATKNKRKYRELEKLRKKAE